MIAEYIRYKVPETRKAEFVSAYQQAEAPMKNSPHCLAYELSECVEEPGRYILRIEWDSIDGHMNGFRKSAEFRAFFIAIKPYIEMIEEMKHYELTPVSWRKV